jgi:hypothetical protein
VIIFILIKDREVFMRSVPGFTKNFLVEKERLELGFFLNEVLSNTEKYNTAIINFDEYYVQYSFNELDEKRILYLCETVSEQYTSNPIGVENPINWEALSKYGYKSPTKHFNKFHKDMAIDRSKPKDLLIEELFYIMEEVYGVQPSTLTVNYF